MEVEERAKFIRALTEPVLRRNQGKPLEPGMIRDAVGKAAKLATEISGPVAIDLDALVRELETDYAVHIGKARVLEDATDHVPWLEAKKKNINWFFWNRYRLHMADKIPPASLDALDTSMEEVLSRLEDPNRKGRWDRRGLVVGHVQSGKTANYTGLICKAADAGYKVIVVLTGIHESLRVQTQIRLEEGFVGYKTGSPDDEREVIGVGKITMPNSERVPNIDTVTDRGAYGDFRRSGHAIHIHPDANPRLFVIKKNVGVLGNLLRWIRQTAPVRDGARQHHPDVPLLVIDDEADNASIDTSPLSESEKKQADPTKINANIRQLLRAFDQCSYVGFTATPFANVFISDQAQGERFGDDLFPRSFALCLPSPSNYFGPTKVFGLDASPNSSEQEGLDLTYDVNDWGPSKEGAEPGWMPAKHKMNHRPTYDGREQLPPSLKEAIKCFLLSSASRRARGQEKKHSSMLIHVSRFTDVQGIVKSQVSDEVERLQGVFKNGDGAAVPIRKAFRELWERQYVPTTERLATSDPSLTTLTWEVVESHLAATVDSVTIKEMNGEAGDVLDYETSEVPLTVIAVGGDKLARGLTLEGLSVSYFLRPSTAYDTLMQMGRWFGYRPGYTDLCRLYMPASLKEWYRHVATANEELREEFERMAEAGMTPREFGLRVRSHPKLMVTAASKMRNATKIRISYEASVSEPVSIDIRPEQLVANEKAAREFLSKLGAPMEKEDERPGRSNNVSKTLIWSNQPAREVCEFLAKLKMSPGATRATATLWREYIQKMNEKHGELTSWTIALLSNRDDGSPVPFAGFNQIGLFRRMDFGADPSPTEFKMRRLLSPADEALDLTDEEREQARAASPGSGKTGRLSPAAIRQVRPRTRGLCLLYPLRRGLPDEKGASAAQRTDVDGERVDESLQVPPLGVALSFPGSKNPEKVVYAVNARYWREHFGEPEAE